MSSDPMTTAACDIPCDDDCGQPCHSVHQVSAMRFHEPEACPAAAAACVVKGPYHPVGDVDFECRTHGVVAVLRDPARYGAGNLRLTEVRCPVGEPDA